MMQRKTRAEIALRKKTDDSFSEEIALEQHSEEQDSHRNKGDYPVGNNEILQGQMNAADSARLIQLLRAEMSQMRDDIYQLKQQLLDKNNHVHPPVDVDSDSMEGNSLSEDGEMVGFAAFGFQFMSNSDVVMAPVTPATSPVGWTGFRDGLFFNNSGEDETGGAEFRFRN